MSLPPRILVIMSDQSRRALIRAALREVGYDAIGASDMDEARRYRAIEPGRGTVQLVVVDQDNAVREMAELREILASHHGPRVVLLAHATHEPPAGPWSRIVRRPVSVEDVVAAVRSELPLPEQSRNPLD